MEFEWDENKNIENIKRRGISFEKAVKAFDDDLAIPLEDVEHSHENETRYALIGMCQAAGLIFISFTFRGENCRIISARKASKKMERMYADNDRKRGKLI
ncbi:MAG: BrnT family toxin [Acidobacteria bacterium]|nr:BrnT family toxin [Acidobacteriota bacterium]MCA1637058.1 BrnT family toxin [Acidobacteriota bacterium]